MTTFHILDMSCGHCQATVEKTRKALDRQAQVTFDIDARLVQLDSSAKVENVKAALAEAGYPASPA